jgi:3',5'-nucleoside bisphosphate phosphatase
MPSLPSNQVRPLNTPFVDLHIHSHFSGDGQYSPDEIFKFAGEVGLDALAISDHDSVEAIPRGLELAAAKSIEFIPSIELTTEFDGRELHVLGPLIDWASSRLRLALERQMRGRFEQALERIARLRQIGFNVTYEEVSQRSQGSPPSGTTIAAVILDKHAETRDARLEPYIRGLRSDKPEIRFYQDFMGRGAPAHVHRTWIATEEGIQLLIACGAVPVLAHPGAGIFSAGERIVSDLKAVGLKGLEVFTPYHDEKMSAYYLGLAKKLNLIPTAGSDFHGRIKPHVTFGSVRAIGPELISVLRSCKRSGESFEGNPPACN